MDCAVPENIHTPPTEGIGISWGRGAKKFKGVGSLRKNPFRGGSMDNFWNYTLNKYVTTLLV